MSRAVATTVVQVDFARPAPLRHTLAPTGRIPRVARLLALAHDIERRIQAGELRDLADAARALGLTRPRVTQVSNLLLLSPEIQEEILDLPPVTSGRDPISERTLRAIVAEAEWEHQWMLWQDVTCALRGME